jgi:hypothetical protein
MTPQIDNTYDPLAWGSHLAPLMGCLGATSGQVLELGIGHFSTPILHEYCVWSGRKLVSVEDNKEWFDTFKEPYERSLHKFINASYADIVPELAKEKWGVVFIDNSPGGQRRADDFASLIHSTDFVVVHDYHGENEDAISPLLGPLKANWKKYSKYQPPTLIASLTRP